MEGWLKVMARIASRLKAGLGFYIHAFSEAVLQDPARYAPSVEGLYEALAEIARYAERLGQSPLSSSRCTHPTRFPGPSRGHLNTSPRSRSAAASPPMWPWIRVTRQARDSSYARTGMP